jgi:2-dehydro-3-deoxy-L-rhamnonate dehydrogenase (NAD+)
MWTALTGKVAIVTGAAMGIGQAVALRLAGDGCNIVLVDLEKDLLAETASMVEKLGRKTLIFPIDISDWQQVEAMAKEAVKVFGRIDILVNSAGILGPNVPIWEYPIEAWDRVMSIDLKGTFLLCKAVIGQMRSQKSGRIVNLASIAGKEGNPLMCGYTSAKAGVIAFTRGLALEVAQEGIVVNSIAPTVIEGRISKETTPEQQKVFRSKIPMNRLGKPEEVANLIRFLVSDECSFSTGCCYDISGGRAVY